MDNRQALVDRSIALLQEVEMERLPRSNPLRQSHAHHSARSFRS
jgi:hypothetical protein